MISSPVSSRPVRYKEPMAERAAHRAIYEIDGTTRARIEVPDGIVLISVPSWELRSQSMAGCTDRPVL